MSPAITSLPTVEWIWNHLSENSDSAPARLPDRRDKLRLVFPESFCAEIFSRSPSYLSWFLHRMPQAKPLCDRLYAFFSVSAGPCLHEMSDKCLALVYQNGVLCVSANALLAIVGEFAKCLPNCFGVHTKAYSFLEDLCFRAPARALALLFLLAGINGHDQEALEKARLYWQGSPGTEEASLQDLFRLALTKLRDGQKTDAFGILTEIIGQKNVDEKLAGDVHLLLGNQYRFGEGVPVKTEKALEHYRKALDKNNYDACFPLFELSAADDQEAAASWLFLGASHGQMGCHYELGRAYYEGSPLVEGERNFQKAVEYLSVAADDTMQDNEPPAPAGYNPGAAQFLLARLLFEKKTAKDQELALLYLTKAAKNGCEDAVKELLRCHLQEKTALNPKEDASVPHYIFASDASAKTLHLLETLPEKDAQILLCQSADGHLPTELEERPAKTDPRPAADICAGLLSSDPLPRMTFLFLAEDEKKNLSDTQSLLSVLHKYEHALAELAGKVRIFLKAENRAFAALIDSLMNRLSPFYVPLYLWAPGKDAAELLLDNYPLFLPLLQKERPSTVQIAMIGSGPSIPWLLKDALTLIGSPKLPFALSCVTEDASVEKAFFAECPAYADPLIRIPRVQPQFFSVREKPEFLFANRQMKDADRSAAEAAAAVLDADYIIIDTGEDLRNLTLGMQLREMLLARDISFKRFPSIAIYCEDPQIASLAETVTAGSEKFGYAWYNNYQLIVYGPGSRLGSWTYVIDSRLEQRAQALHLGYYGIREKLPAGHKAVIEALQSYFARQYNRESSRLAALYAVYALAERGIFWPSPEMYALLSNQTPLARQYEANAQRSSPKSWPTLELAIEREHDRWARFMMTRGWQRASRQQVLAYLEQGNPRAQFYLAKLHPLLCSWEELGVQEPVPTGMQAFYAYIYPRLFPGKTPPSLKEYDRANVDALPELLKIGS